MAYNANFNEVVEKALEVLCHLIQLGYFDSLQDIKCTVNSLIKLLNPDEEFGSQSKKEGV